MLLPVFNQNTIDRWTKEFILSLRKKGNIGIANNYRSISLTSIVVKIYNGLLCHHIEPKMEKIHWKNQYGFWRNPSTSQILTISRILEGVHAKSLEATIFFAGVSKALDSIHRAKMEQILQTYGLPKETVEALMMLYKNTKVAGVL